MSLASGVVRVKLLGRQPDQRCPQWYLFSISVGLEHERSRFIAELWLGVQGAKRWKLQRICILQYLKLGLKLHFFHVHCNTKSQENSKRSKILNFQVSYQRKFVCLYFYLDDISQILKANKESQISAIFIIYNFMVTASVRTLFSVLKLKNDHQKSSRLKVYLGRSNYWAVLRLFVLRVFQNPAKKFGAAHAEARNLLDFSGGSGGMPLGKILKMDLSNWLEMHFLLIVKITLQMLVCIDVFTLDVPILMHGIKNNIFNTQNLKWALGFFTEIWGLIVYPQAPRLLRPMMK